MYVNADQPAAASHAKPRQAGSLVGLAAAQLAGDRLDSVNLFVADGRRRRRNPRRSHEIKSEMETRQDATRRGREMRAYENIGDATDDGAVARPKLLAICMRIMLSDDGRYAPPPPARRIKLVIYMITDRLSAVK